MSEAPHEKRDIRDFTKLKISDGMIHYFIHGQDGTRVAMVAPDRIDNRLFVSWVQIHDSYVAAAVETPDD